MSNPLLDYSQHFASRTALWHVHTDYTDARHSVEEVFDLAVRSGITFICFIEHIRRNPSYSPRAFRDRVRRCSLEHGIEAIVGFEAKLLQDGTLDLPEQDLDAFVFLAEHGRILPKREDYVSALPRGLSHPAVTGWVHPGLFAQSMGWTLSDAELERIVSAVQQNELVYEVNIRRGLPAPPLSDALERASVPFFTGVDFHQEEDLELILRKQRGPK